MAKVSGVNVSSIVNINTTDATSISYISGIATSILSGWPSVSGSAPTLLANPGWLTTGSQNNYESALSISATSGSWTLSGATGSYVYKWFVSGTLVQTQYSPIFQPGKDGAPGTWLFSQPTLGINVTSSYLFQPISLQITASNGYGSGSTQIDAVVTDQLYNAYVSNSGITNSTTLNALQYLQKELRNIYAIEVLLDYYPLAGTTKDQQKWSMRNPDEYLNFSSGWTFNDSGSKATGTGSFATSSYINTTLAPGLLFYSATNTAVTNTASLDIGLYDTNYENYYKIQVFSKVTASIGIPYFYMNFITRHGGPGGAIVNGNYRNDNPTDGWYGIRRVQAQDYTYSPIITGSVLNSTQWATGEGFNNTKLVIGGKISGSMNNSSTKLYQFVAIDNGVNLTNINNIVQTYNSMLGR
jgi:hypothetical protein